MDTRELISVVDFHTLPLNLEVENTMWYELNDCSLDSEARANNLQ